MTAQQWLKKEYPTLTDEEIKEVVEYANPNLWTLEADRFMFQKRAKDYLKRIMKVTVYIKK